VAEPGIILAPIGSGCLQAYVLSFSYLTYQFVNGAFKNEAREFWKQSISSLKCPMKGL
jgi:hypothetical protein